MLARVRSFCVSIRTWWANRGQAGALAVAREVRDWFEVALVATPRVIAGFGAVTGSMAVIGIVATYAVGFNPAFGEQFPVLVEWFAGWTQFYEFVLKTVLKGLEALFHGPRAQVEFLREFNQAAADGLRRVWDWISAIQF